MIYSPCDAATPFGDPVRVDNPAWEKFHEGLDSQIIGDLINFKIEPFPSSPLRPIYSLKRPAPPVIETASDR